jgi:hypothetical protein
LWSQLHSGGLAPGAHQQISTVEIDAAYNLAKLPDVTPDSTLGAEVLHALTQALPPADEGSVADREPADIESEDSNAEDRDVTPHTRAIDGIAVLLSRDDWRDAHAESLRTLLRPYLDSDDATSRLSATRAFTYMYPDAASHMEAAATRLRTESNDYIRQVLLNELWQHRFRDPLAVDQTLAQLSDLPVWTCLSQEPDGDARFSDNHGELCIRITAILACQHDTPFATHAVRNWLHDPMRFPSRGKVIATTLRDALNPADPALRQTQERAFSFVRTAVDAALARDSDQSANTRPAAQSRAVATEFGHQLYFASGAADPDAAPGAPPRRGPASPFAILALSILADLAGIADPRLAHHIIKILDHLRDTQPGRVLAIAATTVTSTEAYARDQIGLQDVSTLIQHVLAEYRAVITSSAEGLAAVRTMLSSFVRLGWDSAIELYEQMNDLNRL